MINSMNYLEARLKARGTPFTAGDKLSMADLCIFSLINTWRSGNFDGVDTGYLSQFPTMEALVLKVIVSFGSVPT